MLEGTLDRERVASLSEKIEHGAGPACGGRAGIGLEERAWRFELRFEGGDEGENRAGGKFVGAAGANRSITRSAVHEQASHVRGTRAGADAVDKAGGQGGAEALEEAGDGDDAAGRMIAGTEAGEAPGGGRETGWRGNSRR
jgi:hypothetical protein